MPEGCLWHSKWDTSCSFLLVLQQVPLALLLSLNHCSCVPKSLAYVLYHFHMLSSSMLIFFSEAPKSTSFSHFSHCCNKKTQQSILYRERSTLAQVLHSDGNQSGQQWLLLQPGSFPVCTHSSADWTQGLSHAKHLPSLNPNTSALGMLLTVRVSLGSLELCMSA